MHHVDPRPHRRIGSGERAAFAWRRRVSVLLGALLAVSIGGCGRGSEDGAAASRAGARELAAPNDGPRSGKAGVPSGSRRGVDATAHPPGLGEDLPVGGVSAIPENRVAGVSLPDPAPNVLLIVVDTLRADHLSCYGSRRSRTPNLDALAAEGVLFEWTLSSTPNTVLSMASLMTSLWPAENGVQWQMQQLDDRNLTLAEILKTSGYRTSAVLGNAVLRGAQGFRQGFDAYSLHNFFVGEELTDLALADLERLASEDGGPWFQWVHYLDPHWPYDPPEAWAGRTSRDPELLPIALDYVRRVGSPDPERSVSLEQAFFRNTLPDDLHQEVRALYEASVAYVDHEIGRLLDGLEARGLADDTIVVVTADHGESLGEHGLFYTHDPYVYDPDLHIPLLWRAPGSFGLKAGHRVSKIVRQIDVLPTLLELLGVQTERPFSGLSLVPLLRGEEESFPRLAFSQSVPLGLQPEVKDEYAERPRMWRRGLQGVHRSVRVQDWRLVAVPEPEGTRWELYNTHVDPRERWDLIQARTFARHREHPREREVERDLRRRLTEWVSAARGVEGAVPELSPDDRAALEALGYISTSSETKKDEDEPVEDGETGDASDTGSDPEE